MWVIFLDAASADLLSAAFSDTAVALGELFRHTVLVLTTPFSPRSIAKLQEAVRLSIVDGAHVKLPPAERGQWVAQWLSGQPCPPEQYVVIDGSEGTGNALPPARFIFSRGVCGLAPTALAIRLIEQFNKIPSAQKEEGQDGPVDGIVKRYNPTKGYGFISHNDADVFVHQSAILSEGFRGLNVGSRVQFTLSRDQNGRPIATNVVQRTLYRESGRDGVLVEGGKRPSRKDVRALPPATSARTPKELDRTHHSSHWHPHRRGSASPFTFVAHDGTTYFGSPYMFVPQQGVPQQGTQINLEAARGGDGRPFDE